MWALNQHAFPGDGKAAIKLKFNQMEQRINVLDISFLQ
jgi:hypothetical protein